MASFENCYPFTLANEAGTPPNYAAVFDPTKNDPRAYAIAGINSAFFPSQFNIIDQLPLNQRAPAVATFYEATYWNRWMADLASDLIAAYILDAEVNEGQRIGADILQDGIDACGGGVAVDGILGPLTIAAANAIPPATLFPAIHAARDAAYRKIGGPNLPAWLARAAKVPQVS